MKLSSIKVGIGWLLIGIMLVGCGNKNESETIEPSSQTTNNAKTYENSNEEVIDDAIIEATDEEHYEEINDYFSVLKGEKKVYFAGDSEPFDIFDWFEYGGNKYAIYDLNQDGEEELMVMVQGSWLQVIHFENGKYIVADSPFYTGATGEIVLKDGLVMLEDTNHAGRYSYEVYKYNLDHTFSSEKDFVHWFPDESSGTTTDSYLVSEKEEMVETTKTEYEEIRNQYFSMIDSEIHWKSITADEADLCELTNTEIKTRRMSLEDMLYAYEALYEYQGDMGELFDEYKNIVLSKEWKDCHLERFIDKENQSLCYYRLTSDNQIILETPQIERFPNSIERFSFIDVDYDQCDEILMNSYTESTGGFVVTESFLFDMNDDGTFQMTELVKDGTTDKQNLLKPAETLENEAASFSEFYTVRDVSMKQNVVDFLVDFGYKDGADQSVTYYGLRVFMNDEEMRYFLSRNLAEITWPFDVIEYN